MYNNIMKNKKAIVYKITCNENGRIYIGATTCGLSKRIGNHKYKPAKKMIPDIEKYGWKSFSVEIIYEGSETECFGIKEPKYIKDLKPYYNTAEGGWGNNGLYGENNPAAKLTESEVLEIRYKYFDNEYTQVDLANKYNISQSVISAVIRGEHWGDIGGPISKDNVGRHTTIGERSGRAKFSNEEVKEIREIFSEGGYNYTSLGKILECDGTSARKMILGITYEEADGPIKGIDYN